MIETINYQDHDKPVYEILGFINDVPELQDKKFLGYPVLGGSEIISELVGREDERTIAFGVQGNPIRRQVDVLAPAVKVFGLPPAQGAGLRHPRGLESYGDVPADFRAKLRLRDPDRLRPLLDAVFDVAVVELVIPVNPRGARLGRLSDDKRRRRQAHSDDK